MSSVRFYGLPSGRETPKRVRPGGQILRRRHCVSANNSATRHRNQSPSAQTITGNERECVGGFISRFPRNFLSCPVGLLRIENGHSEAMPDFSVVLSETHTNVLRSSKRSQRAPPLVQERSLSPDILGNSLGPKGPENQITNSFIKLIFLFQTNFIRCGPVWSNAVYPNNA